MPAATPRLFAVSGALLLATAIALPRWSTGPVPHFVSGLLYGVGGSLLLAALLRWQSPAPCDSATPALRRRYLREFTPAVVAYLVTVLLSVWLLKRIEPTPARAAVALLPLPAVALMLRAVVRYIRDADELQRRIEVESLAIATGVVSMGYLGAGLLQTAKVIAIPASAAMIWVLPLICLVYALAKVAVSRRYA